MITLEFEQLLIRKYKIRYMRDFMWPKNQVLFLFLFCFLKTSKKHP